MALVTGLFMNVNFVHANGAYIVANMNLVTDSDSSFDSIVNSEKQKMYLLNDTNVLLEPTLTAGALEAEQKGTEVYVLNLENNMMAKILTPSGNIGYVAIGNLTDRKELIFDTVNELKYADSDEVEIKALPFADSEIVGALEKNDEVKVVGRNDSQYVQTDSGYVLSSDLMDEQEQETPTVVPQNNPTNSSWTGAVLSRSAGAVQGPSGKETYYNLDMSVIISIMSAYGYSSSDYWVRDDGVKMLGSYVMCAANFTLRPRGSLVETSLGTAIVCDTGGFATGNPTQIDIATAW